MKPFVCLVVISAMLSAVCGLKCFTCWSVNPGTCDRIWPCPAHYDRCASSIVSDNLISMECMRSDMCNRVYSVGVQCCSEDLCNGAKHAGLYAPLLLAPFIAITTLFL